MSLAVSSQALPWLGLLSLLPLLRAIQVLTPSAASVAGGTWGASVYLFSVYSADAVMVPGALSLVLMASIPAIYSGVGSYATRRVGFSPLVLGVGWMLAEFALRPVALQSGLLAGTQGDGVLNQVIGQTFGYVLVAFAVAYASACILAILTRIRFRICLPALPIGFGDTGRYSWDPAFLADARLIPRNGRPRAPPR